MDTNLAVNVNQDNLLHTSAKGKVYIVFKHETNKQRQCYLTSLPGWLMTFLGVSPRKAKEPSVQQVQPSNMTSSTPQH